MADSSMMAGMGKGDPREVKSTNKYNLERIDFEWASTSTDLKELFKAYEALKEDAGFPDLMRAVGKRIVELDPKQRSRIFEGGKASYEDEQAVAKDLIDFLSDMQVMDSQLSSGKIGTEENDDKFIFTSKKESLQRDSAARSLAIEEIEKKNIAENERIKGNEFMSAKEYQEAIKCYTKSLEFLPNVAATFSNRALAFLRLKEYAKVIEDSNKAIEIDPKFIKAYHRRGKAYQAVNKLDLAVKDFQFILEIEPHNKEAMNELKSLRKEQEGKKPAQKQRKTSNENDSSASNQQQNIPTENGQQKPLAKAQDENKQLPQQQEPKKFVRVAIEEESDEEEEKESTSTIKIENVSADTKQTDVNSKNKQQDTNSKKAGIEVVQSKENETWWKEQPTQPNSFKRIQIQEDEEEEEEETRLAPTPVIEKKQTDQIKTTSPVKTQQPQVQQVQQDLESKERQAEKVKVESVLKEMDAIKERASVEYKKGMYDDAIKIYEEAVQVAEKNIPNLKYLKKDLIQSEASIFNNIAACYKQGHHNKKEVEYCTKVIERAPYLSDLSMLAKAYIRRGYAYEHLEKYADAKDDMTRVRELQPSNQEASKALIRLTKALQDANKVDLSDIEIKIAKFKDAGNAQYSLKKFKEAIEKFTEGVELYLQYAEHIKKDRDIKLKVTQIYTNRSLSYHQLNDQIRAFEDAEYVLKQLDSANPKALFRKAIANKSFGKFEESVKDLQTLFKQDPSKKDIKDELDECMKKLVQSQQAKKEKQAEEKTKPQTQTSKIQEMSSTINELKEQVEAEEKKAQELSRQAEEIQKAMEKTGSQEETKSAPAQPKKTKNLNQEIIDKAADIASQKTSSNLMRQVPKTAAGLETDYNSLKKDLPKFYQYITNIPAATIEQLFKTVEISPELFASIMKVFREFGLSEDIKQTAQLIKSLAKASNFDMTLMFMDSKEKNDLKEIVKAVKNSSEIENTLVKEIVQIYNF